MREIPSPFGPKPLEITDARVLADIMRALADPARLRLLSLVAEADKPAVQLVEEIGYLRQPTVLHHLHVLLDAGLLTRYRGVGTFLPYTLHTAMFDALAEALRPPAVTP